MRFYSDMLEKFFDSEEECLWAEKETLDKSRKAIQRANDELELKELRKRISDLRTNLENSLEEYYRLQNKYFDNYGTLCDMIEEVGHLNHVGEKDDYCDYSDNCDCDCKYSDDDNCDCATKDKDDFNHPITIHMATYRPFKDTYPHLWKFFGGK